MRCEQCTYFTNWLGDTRGGLCEKHDWVVKRSANNMCSVGKPKKYDRNKQKRIKVIQLDD